MILALVAQARNTKIAMVGTSDPKRKLELCSKIFWAARIALLM